MSVEKHEEIKVIKSKDTGMVNVQTTIFTTEKRPLIPHITTNDAIRTKQERKTHQEIKAWISSAGIIGGVIGGLNLVSAGITNLNPEQIASGIGIWALAAYIVKDAKNAFYEANLAAKEISKIKRTR